MSVVAFPLQDRRKHKSDTSGPTADEGLQLIHAFMKIEDREKRSQLIRLAELYSCQQYPPAS